jgi:hypothetical protein
MFDGSNTFLSKMLLFWMKLRMAYLSQERSISVKVCNLLEVRYLLKEIVFGASDLLMMKLPRQALFG